MTSQQQLLETLLMSPEFREAINAALVGQLEHLTERVRYHARNGEAVAAANAEGKLYSLESVLQLLDAYVAKGRKNDHG